MKFERHLYLAELLVPPSGEWMDASPGWRLLRVSKGAAYWLGEGEVRELKEGDLIAVASGGKGCLRASQLGEIKLDYFHFCPELLTGFLTLAERHYLQTTAARAGSAVRFLPASHPAALEFAALLADPTPANNLLHRCQLMHVVASVFAEEMARHHAPVAKSAAAQNRFKQLINEMPDGDLIKYTPEQLAKLCGCSLRHFSRLFRHHFGIAIRVKQTELRLLKARQLLSDTDAKIIHVALESGYRHLGLFNSMFKKYLGMTPSEWRHKNLKKPRPQKFARVAGLCLAALSLIGSLRAAQSPEPRRLAAVNPVPTNTTATAKSTNTLAFPVEGYEITGNTLLSYSELEPIFTNYVGAAVTLDTIRQALADFQMAYRNRGFVTVKVGLPPQSITNGLVKMKVIEGRLAEINVLNNRWFSSNNVMRALPSLSTNIMLNSLVLQRDLDRANGNRDRQISAVLDDGPAPGTTLLNLKVKDRFPLHGRMELNNYATPDTPELRLNSAVQYNNLWQLEHQVGLQYSFTPQAMKEESQMPAFYDQPLIANYSAFYRIPLDFNKAKDRGRDYQVSDFGFDEVTHRFRAPPSSDFPDLIVFASRSFSDTGLNLQSQTVTQPTNYATAGGLQIKDTVHAQTLTRIEGLGFRVSGPLPEVKAIHSSLSLGLDYKSYRTESLQREVFEGSLSIPSSGDVGPPFDVYPAAVPPPATRSSSASVQYLPLALGWDASKQDKWGVTSFNLAASVNFSAVFNNKSDFQAVAGTSGATGNYLILNPGLTREQKIVGDWGLRLHADGQWVNQSLIEVDQFGLGGVAGPRGYRDGQEYGDTGWRTTVEPHTPLWKVGMVDETLPMFVRFLAFNDYGHRYLLHPVGGRRDDQALWGAGFGMNAVVGERLDFRFTIGFPLIETPGVKPGVARISFSLNAQF